VIPVPPAIVITPAAGVAADPSVANEVDIVDPVPSLRVPAPGVNAIVDPDEVSVAKTGSAAVDPSST